MLSFMMKVKVRLFGAFRDWVPGAALELDLPEMACARDAKQALVGRMGELGHFAQAQALVLDSVLADQENTLRDDDIIKTGVELAVLPPVCGG